MSHERRWMIASPRLQMKRTHGSAGIVQGGWWPLTDELHVELQHLLAALSSRSGTIERVIYDERSWAPASMRMEFRAHSVILEPSNTSPNTLTVSGKNFGTLVLLVVPPDTDPTAAHAAVMAAAHPDDVSSAAELLAIGMRAAHDGRPDWQRATAVGSTVKDDAGAPVATAGPAVTRAHRFSRTNIAQQTAMPGAERHAGQNSPTRSPRRAQSRFDAHNRVRCDNRTA
ncbi:DUF5994 family protein [Mycolicibacterium gadium]|uniref:DUF5994 family protein n=1 Tax=Mycolicibacterium gadium TaxID=1794 RepID=A0ABT6GL60_MYCGU|nr:DUF5994 family protein [Mycolicibacterium gadium]MDG5481995.1 DUF5994 family protein [Mycolicibacterium gadium]